MTQVLTADLDQLRKEVLGEVVLPGDPAYDAARTVWNGAISRRPAVIVRAAAAADVSAAIAFARLHDLEIAVRGGAHNTAGLSVVDDGLMIDLSPMHDVQVDVGARRCRVGGGATLAQRDGATQEHGLASTAGIIGHTGVGGLTLSGGMGHLTRRHGLAIDNLLSAEIVTADGEIRTASAGENPDLFWAIRGGGGNFGVVTTFEFRLHQVGPIVDVGIFFCPLERGAEVLRLTRELFTSMSTDLNVIVGGATIPPAPFVPPEHHGKPGYLMLVTGFGADDEHARVAGTIRQRLAPVAEMVSPMPYAALQQMFDEQNRFGLFAYDRATYLEDLTDAAIEVITEQVPRKVSPMSVVFFYRLDAAYSAVPDDETAFGGGRSPRYAVFLIALGEEPAVVDADTSWVQDFWAALQPHAMGSGSYLNGEAEFTEDRVRATYGAKYDRLAAVKHRYDPDNVFHRNANITAAPQPPRQRPAST